MPRGVPKDGIHWRTKRKLERQAAEAAAVVPVIVETDEEIEQKLSERFEVLELMTNDSLKGEVRSLVVSGPGGLGKSYTVERAVGAVDPDEERHTIIKGYVKATGLYRLLWSHRSRNKVIIFDDADSSFLDDKCLNMLKAVCDTTETRRVSYLADYDMVDGEEGEIIPRSFVFEGTIIFISNMDWDAEVARGHKLSVHLEAMMTRSHYIDLAMKTKRDYMIRIKQVVRQGMLEQHGLCKIGVKDVMEYIEENFESLRDLSLRMAIKLADLRRSNPTGWKKVANITCRKTA